MFSATSSLPSTFSSCPSSSTISASAVLKWTVRWTGRWMKCWMCWVWWWRSCLLGGGCWGGQGGGWGCIQKVKDVNGKEMGQKFYLNLKIFNILEEDKRTQTIFNLIFGLNQVMLRRHQSLVLNGCKNQHRHKYRNTLIPGSLQEWRGGECSRSSWLQRLAATARSSLL